MGVYRREKSSAGSLAAKHQTPRETLTAGLSNNNNEATFSFYFSILRMLDWDGRLFERRRENEREKLGIEFDPLVCLHVGYVYNTTIDREFPCLYCWPGQMLL